ncbi:unnamed protein product [Discula destructiva]
MATWASTADGSWGAGGGSITTTDFDDSADPTYEHISQEDKEERKPRLRRKLLEELQTERLEGKEKFISIYARDAKTGALIEFKSKFSRSAAAVFSAVWKKQLEGAGGAIIIDGKIIDGDYLEPAEHILDWINLCVDEGNDVKFPEIVETSEDSDALNLLIEIIKVADKLKIPEMSLQAHLKKAAIRYARQHLITIENVEIIYDENDKEYIEDSESLREAAAASIFEAWWLRILDQPEYDDYCSYIEQLRVEFPKLDEDLNKRFDAKKEYIEKKRDEKREELRHINAAAGGRLRGGARFNGRGRFGGVAGYGGTRFQSSSAADYPETNGADGGWGHAAAIVGDAHVAEWDVAGGAKAAETEEWPSVAAY